MARRVVDSSDDGFPDLGELIHGRGASVKGKQSLTRSTSQKTGKAGKKIAQETEGEDVISKSRKEYGIGTGRRTGLDREIEKGKESAPVKKTIRKRVLKPTADNPLLRPQSRTGIRSASLDLKETGWRRKARPEVEESIGAMPKNKSSKSRKSVESSHDREPDAFVEVQSRSRQNSKTRKPATRALSKPVSTPDAKIESDEEDFGLDSDGLSDFIDNDSTFHEEEDYMVEAPPPRSVRRLVKGRQPVRDDGSDEALELRMGKLTVVDDTLKGSKQESVEKALQDFGDSYPEEETPPRASRSSKPTRERQSKTSKPVMEPSGKQRQVPPPSSPGLDDPFTLSYSPSENKPRKVSREARFATPPGSPQLRPKTLLSPKKLPQIPKSPHRPSMDSFWEQDVINEWNDEYSPQKKVKPKPKLQPNEDLSGDLLFSPTKKSPIKQDRAVRDAKKAFSEKKRVLAESFLAELDTKITGGKISELAASTSGVQIIWSKKLNTTAGRANWKRETIESLCPVDGKIPPPTYRHHAAIELAEKVIDDEDRLLNVIAHEFCHLANFMISNIKTNPHGKEFKEWAAKVSRRFVDRGIEVTTKHSYEIDYKYVWECVNCGLEFKRHSRSIAPARHQCGKCKSKLVQTKPVPRNGAANGEKKVSEYQMFVKENMKRVRKENPGSPQKEIMGLLGKRYQEYKASKLKGNEKETASVSIGELVGSKEGTPDEGVAFVARKLDFLELTSD